MRPKLITFFCIVLFAVGGLQFAGSLGAIIVGSGFGPDKIFARDKDFEVPVDEMESEVPTIQQEGQASSAETAAPPEHVIPAGKYGLLISFIFIISLVGLWKMKKWGAYSFGAVSAVNIGTMLVWKPEWVIQSQSSASVWMSLLLSIIYCAVVLPYWKQMNLKIEPKPKQVSELVQKNPILKLWE